MVQTFDPKSDYKVVGTEPIRHDGLEKVTGRAVYGADVKVPGLIETYQDLINMPVKSDGSSVVTLGDLVQFNKNDLLKFRNFGKKSLTELDELVESKNLSFGMDLSKYKLDKD